MFITITLIILAFFLFQKKKFIETYLIICLILINNFYSYKEEYRTEINDIHSHLRYLENNIPVLTEPTVQTTTKNFMTQSVPKELEYIFKKKKRMNKILKDPNEYDRYKNEWKQKYIPKRPTLKPEIITTKNPDLDVDHKTLGVITETDYDLIFEYETVKFKKNGEIIKTLDFVDWNNRYYNIPNKINGDLIIKNIKLTNIITCQNDFLYNKFLEIYDCKDNNFNQIYKYSKNIKKDNNLELLYVGETNPNYNLYVKDNKDIFEIYLVEFIPPESTGTYMFKKRFIYSCKDNESKWVDIENNTQDIKLKIKMNDFQHKFNTITNFLKVITGNLIISETNLKNLYGLKNLKRVYGDIIIKYNKELISCCGIKNINEKFVNGKIVVYNNNISFFPTNLNINKPNNNYKNVNGDFPSNNSCFNLEMSNKLICSKNILDYEYLEITKCPNKYFLQEYKLDKTESKDNIHIYIGENNINYKIVYNDLSNIKISLIKNDIVEYKFICDKNNDINYWKENSTGKIIPNIIIIIVDIKKLCELGIKTCETTGTPTTPSTIDPSTTTPSTTVSSTTAPSTTDPYITNEIVDVDLSDDINWFHNWFLYRNWYDRPRRYL